ncbi:MAG TPA: LytTR family DNA-binding domain-containing protein [Gemmatimonadaceae bacterium]|nr:LytTR family DNA-binding domain-containing protein [Gemmatimonadaceae bacterium]
MSFVPLREKGREIVVAVPQPASESSERAADSIRIVAKNASGVVLLPLSDIECLEADGNVVVIHTSRDVKYRIRESLSNMFEQLHGYGFIRVHRGTVVRAAAIVGIEKGRYRKAFCVLRTAGRFEIGRVEFQRLRPLWQTGVLDLSALSAGLRLLPQTS